MQLKISFTVSGEISQLLELEPGVDPEQLIKDLNAGNVLTAHREGMEIQDSDGRVLARVLESNKGTEVDYTDFIENDYI